MDTLFLETIGQNWDGTSVCMCVRVCGVKYTPADFMLIPSSPDHLLLYSPSSPSPTHLVWLSFNYGTDGWRVKSLAKCSSDHISSVIVARSVSARQREAAAWGRA